MVRWVVSLSAVAVCFSSTSYAMMGYGDPSYYPVAPAAPPAPPATPDSSRPSKSEPDSKIAKMAVQIPEVAKLMGTGSSRVTMEEIAAKMAYFDLVIVVNKATSAQTINVYKKSSCSDGKGGQVPCVKSLWTDKDGKTIAHRTSTGVEEYGCNKVIDRQSGAAIDNRSIYKQTPTGYYTVDRLDIDHFSGVYDDAHMPYAVFIRDDKEAKDGGVRGIATHKAPGELAELLIGNRESHACIRLKFEDSKEVFRQVMMTGGPVSHNDPGFHAQCNPKLGDNSFNCPSDVESREGAYRSFLSKVPASSYTTKTVIPLVSRETGEMDPQQSRYGYKTLYIIEDVETGAARDYVVDRIVDRPGKNVVSQTGVDGRPQFVLIRGVQHQPISCIRPDNADFNQQYSTTPGAENNFFGNLFGHRW